MTTLPSELNPSERTALDRGAPSLRSDSVSASASREDNASRTAACCTV
jgi:hypothetical protein